MNLYERYGIADQLIAGRRIAIVAPPGKTRRFFVTIVETLEDLDQTADTLSAANGQERIEINGGRLSFVRCPEDLPYSEIDYFLVSSEVRNQPDFYERWLLATNRPARIEVLSS